MVCNFLGVNGYGWICQAISEPNRICKKFTGTRRGLMVRIDEQASGRGVSQQWPECVADHPGALPWFPFPLLRPLLCARLVCDTVMPQPPAGQSCPCDFELADHPGPALVPLSPAQAPAPHMTGLRHSHATIPPGLGKISPLHNRLRLVWGESRRGFPGWVHFSWRDGSGANWRKRGWLRQARPDKFPA